MQNWFVKLVRKRHNPNRDPKFPRDALGRHIGMLTPALQNKIFKLLKTGLFDKQVALGAGIAPITLSKWLLKGMSENATEPYISFTMKYYKIKIDLEVKALKPTLQMIDGNITKNRHNQSIAGLNYLKMRYKSRWGTMTSGIAPSTDEFDISEQHLSESDRLKEVLQNPPPQFVQALDRAGYMLVPKEQKVESDAINILDSIQNELNNDNQE